MYRLLIRISILMMIALVLGVVANHFVIRHRMIEVFKENPPGPLRAFHKMINDRFSELPQELVDGELEKLSEELGEKVQIVSVDDPIIPERIKEDFNEGYAIGEIHKTDRLFLYLKNGKIAIMGSGTRMQLFDELHTSMVILISLSIIALMGFIITFPIVRRLGKLGNAAIRINRGELQARADINSKDAIGELARSFNSMADTNQKLIENQRMLLQAVAHELRTPTARIRFSLEMMMATRDEEQRELRLASIDEDLCEVDDLVGELLMFDSFEDGSPPLHLLQTQALEIVERLKKSFDATRRPEVSIDVAMSDGDVCMVEVDPHSFERAIRNILSNALRYAEKKVRIELKEVDDYVEVRIDDDGPGIEESMRESVFQPFTRLDPSRNKESGGIGLGLALVKRIVDKHGAQIEIKESSWGGTSVITRWPKASND